MHNTDTKSTLGSRVFPLNKKKKNETKISKNLDEIFLSEI